MTFLQPLRNFPTSLLAALLALASQGCTESEAGSGAAAAGSAGSGAALPGGGGNPGGGGAGAPTTAGSGVDGGSGAAAGGASGSGGGGASGSAGAAGMSGAGGGPPSAEHFSFFVTSMVSLFALAKAKDAAAADGFGGDLSYGEAGPGAGLRGADKICSALAEESMPGNNKVWRAFLSATAGEDGQPVNAIERVGSGPWYDRTDRVVAMDVAGLKNIRPTGGDAAIADNLPNELGVPNHRPDPNADEVDNHDTLTGSNEDGELDTNDMGDTCNDWTSKVGETGKPRIGHSWSRSGQVQSWTSTHEAGGCAPGANIFGQGGPADGDLRVGAGGGYGGIYCFALSP